MNFADIQVVILAGGKGARFDHESQVLPKPLIPVCGRPIVEHIMLGLHDQGFRRFMIAAGYMGDRIAEHFVPDSGAGMAYCLTGIVTTWCHPDLPGSKVEVIQTGHDSNTAERLLKLRPYLQSTFALTYGDGLSDVEMSDVWTTHRGAEMPIATLTAVHPPGRFGVLRLDGDDVISFREKSEDDWINGGFMLCEPDIFELIGEYPGSLEERILPKLAESKALRAHPHEGYWRCMDTRRDREQIEDDVRRRGGTLPWRVKMGG